jgi:uncharacterized protein (TIGR02266 family)
MMQLSSSVEQRRHTRINTALLVQYRFDLIEGYRTEYVTDISEGGLFVRTDRPHEAGAYVQLQLTPRNCATIIEGLGLVVRVTRSEENTVGTAAGMGIEFVSFDDAAKRDLEARILAPALST